MQRIKTTDLISTFGSRSGIADSFTPPLSRQAVAKWGVFVPKASALRLKEERPELYKALALPGVKKGSAVNTKKIAEDFLALHTIARATGLDCEAANLAAAKGVKRITGIDPLALIGGRKAAKA